MFDGNFKNSDSHYYSNIILPNNVIFICLLSARKLVNICQAPADVPDSNLSLLNNLLVIRVSWRPLDYSIQGKYERKSPIFFTSDITTPQLF